MSSHTPEMTTQWNELIQTAHAFFAEKPWQKLPKEILFGVYHAGIDQVLYCTAIGGMGDVFGLSIYKGATGLHTYHLTHNQNLQVFEPHYYMDCLLVSFENQSFLSKEDKHILKESGISFPAGKTKPQFRTLSPGYYDMLPAPDDRYTMNLAMQGCLALINANAGQQTSANLDSDQIPVVFFHEKDGMYEIRYQTVEPPKSPTFSAPPLNEIKTLSLLKRFEQKGVWEGSTYFIPEQVKEKGKRAFYPCLIIWADHGNGMIVAVDTSERNLCSKNLVHSLYTTIEHAGAIPQTILVDEEQIQTALEPAALALGISIECVNVLPELVNATALLSEKEFGGYPLAPVLEPIIKHKVDDLRTVAAAIGADFELMEKFAHHLIQSNLQKATIQKHIGNISIYISNFLRGAHDPAIPAEMGIPYVNKFFCQSLQIETNTPTKTQRKAMIASIKKFYTFLTEEGYVSQQELTRLKCEIQLHKDDWTK